MTNIAYLRVSTDDQSIDNQIQTIEQRGYLITETFKDEGVSGSIAGADRPGFNDCLNYLRKGDTLIVVALDRLGRSTIDVLTTIEAIKAKNVTLISLREGLDLSTPAGQMMASVFASFAQMEKEIMLERQAAGIARAKAEGKHLGRPVKASDKEIVRLRAEGYSLSSIAMKTNTSLATVKRYLAKHRTNQGN